MEGRSIDGEKRFNWNSGSELQLCSGWGKVSWKFANIYSWFLNNFPALLGKRINIIINKILFEMMQKLQIKAMLMRLYSVDDAEVEMMITTDHHLWTISLFLFWAVSGHINQWPTDGASNESQSKSIFPQIYFWKSSFLPSLPKYLRISSLFIHF